MSSWTALAAMPQPRMGHVAVADGGKVYLWTGVRGVSGGLAQYATDIDVFDPASGAWTNHSGPAFAGSSAVYLAAAAAKAGQMYFIGGIGNGQTNPSASNVCVLNLASFTASSMAAIPGTYGLIAHTATLANDGLIYVVGGAHDRNTYYSNAVYAYDPTADTWTAKAALPQPRAYHAAALGPDGRIYVSGGRTGQSVDSADALAYDPATNTWDTTLATMSAARSALCAAASAGGLIYTYGGLTPNTKMVAAYSPGTDTWTTLATAPSDLAYAQAVANSDGLLYVTGGSTGSLSSPSSAAYAFAPNSPPNAPIPTSPVGGATVDRTQPITLRATFSDPDPGDTPSASKWRYRVTGAPTWTTVTQNNPLQSYSIPAGLGAGDYEWQAAYADQQGVWGPFCGSAFFTAADPPPGPTYLHPTSGETIGTSSYTGQISTPSLTKSEWTLYADNAGAINLNTVVQGPVTVTTGDLRSHTFTGLANNTPVWWSVRDYDNGLWSQPVQERTPVSYTPPPTPTYTTTADPGSGALVVTITNPAPGAGEPAVSYNNVYIDDLDGKGEIRKAAMLAPNTAWTYALPRSGVDTGVRVEAVADNGTTSST